MAVTLKEVIAGRAVLFRPSSRDIASSGATANVASEVSCMADRNRNMSVVVVCECSTVRPGSLVLQCLGMEMIGCVV